MSTCGSGCKNNRSPLALHFFAEEAKNAKALSEKVIFKSEVKQVHALPVVDLMISLSSLGLVFAEKAKAAEIASEKVIFKSEIAQAGLSGSVNKCNLASC